MIFSFWNTIPFLRQVLFTAQLLRSCCQGPAHRLVRFSVFLMNSEGTCALELVCLSAVYWLLESLLINLSHQSSIFRASWFFRYKLSHCDISASWGREVWMGSPDHWLAQQFIKKSSESVTPLQEKAINVLFISISPICNVRLIIGFREILLYS